MSVRDRKFESARRKLHAMLRHLEFVAGEHPRAHQYASCPESCLENRLSAARIQMLREVIRELGGRT